MAENVVTIGEGADVYGSDGEKWGRVDAVGAKYLTVVEGLLGQREYHVPVSLVACGDADRVELRVPVAEAKAQARDTEPEDEPIYNVSEPIPPRRDGDSGRPGATKAAARWWIRSSPPRWRRTLVCHRVGIWHTTQRVPGSSPLPRSPVCEGDCCGVSADVLR